MLTKKIAFPVLCLLLLSYCTDEKYDIRVACETTPSGNYLIKWETFPPIDGTVTIYESNSPDSFNLSTHIAKVPASKGFVDILAIRYLNRSYFKLVFDKKNTAITSERVVQMPNIYNFRDLGGYYTGNGRQIRWGKLYRSSSLAQGSLQDIEFLNNLGIRTIIDFRTELENNLYPCRYRASQVFVLPLRGNRLNVFFDKILSEEMKRGDVLIHLQDVFSFLLENNSDYFREMFDILLNERNYPIVMHCSLGKDRSGVASALILAALGIDQEQIIDDYTLSNEHVNFAIQFPNAELFDSNVQIQETITALYSAHRETMTYAFEQLVKEYGSVDDYFEKELNLTQRKREKLKELLLY